MQYLALLINKERELTPDERATVWPPTKTSMPRPRPRSAPATRCCPRLPGPASRVVPDAPTITDGPFAEAAEIAGGYYVFEAENLDDALELARGVPAARYGAIEVRPIFHTVDRRLVALRRPVAGAAAGAAGKCQYPGLTGVAGRIGAARRIRGCRGRPHCRRRRIARAGDGDHRAGP